jgi:Na+/glutamate symporter
MMTQQTLEEKKMRCPKKSSVVAILLWVAVILLGPNAVLADSLDVSFVVPSSVNAGTTFSITVNVTNNSNASITFNRVAAGYGLADMKIKGPYEVDTSTHVVAAHSSISFSFNFKIFYGTGSIVPVAVFFAQDSYQNQNMKGGGIVGIKVNSPDNPSN